MEKQYLEDPKCSHPDDLLKRKYAGLIFQGLDENGDAEYLGTENEFATYEEIQDKELFEDEVGIYYLDENESDHSDNYQVDIKKVYLTKF